MVCEATDPDVDYILPLHRQFYGSMTATEAGRCLRTCRVARLLRGQALWLPANMTMAHGLSSVPRTKTMRPTMKFIQAIEASITAT
ncbi:hypothetical protein [Variovorax paradoxus]|uniref:hypothetical protein n=1 Tax=Variovorax paradoxus TaxID=34073 RepID=UPI0005A528BB|nr:hypothetical protein [Variovorax paradoxus]